ARGSRDAPSRGPGPVRGRSWGPGPVAVRGGAAPVRAAQPHGPAEPAPRRALLRGGSARPPTAVAWAPAPPRAPSGHLRDAVLPGGAEVAADYSAGSGAARCGAARRGAARLGPRLRGPRVLRRKALGAAPPPRCRRAAGRPRPR